MQQHYLLFFFKKKVTMWSTSAFQTCVPVVNNNNNTSFIPSGTSSTRLSKLPHLHHHAFNNPALPTSLPFKSVKTTTSVLSPSSPSSPSSSPSSSPPASKESNESTAAKPAVDLEPTTRNRNWMFYDVTRIHLCAGHGGNGIVAFLREKGAPRGGPAGGNGGRGGSIYLRASRSAGNTLTKFRYTAQFRANYGKNGLGKSKHGQAAADVYVDVPLGTIVRNDNDKHIILADLKEEGEVYLAAKGGRGGRGNLAFKNDKNRAPRICEMGEKGMDKFITLELKLIADVALIGLPNAGKSSFLNFVSNANAKIANYPFTTIVPNLGVVNLNNESHTIHNLIMADVPGLIDGAHKGVGMGTSFLRHIERCKILVHLIDGHSIIEKFPNDFKLQLNELRFNYQLIKNELRFFNPKLLNKKEVILINKVDMPDVRDQWESQWRDQLIQMSGHKRISIISAKTGLGVENVVKKLDGLVKLYADEDDENNANAHNIFRFQSEEEEIYYGEEDITVKRLKGLEKHYEIGGYKIKKVYDMTNWDYIEGIDRFQRVLQALGINKRLEQLGIKDGDIIQCFGKEFEYFKEENIYSAAAALDGFID